MNANLQRYIFALNLGVRFALATVNGAAQPQLESPPAVLSVPPPPAASSTGTGRAPTEAGAEGGLSGQVVKGSPLMLQPGELQVLGLPHAARVAVGDGDVLHAQVVAPGQVILIGQAPGTTSLRVFTGDAAPLTYEVAVLG